MVMTHPEHSVIPESEARPPLLWPDQRDLSSFTPGLRVVGFLLVDHRAMQLREGTVIDTTESTVGVKFDERLPVAMRENSNGRTASAFERYFIPNDICLLRRTDYYLLTKNPEYIEEWLQRGSCPGDSVGAYLAAKLKGPGIERVNPGISISPDANTQLRATHRRRNQSEY